MAGPGANHPAVASLAAIVPPGVAYEETTRRDAEAPQLMREEADALGAVAERRRRDFALGRRCAHAALHRLGAPAEPILCGARREPLWPKGYGGSITHCAGYCGAAVSRVSDWRSIGIDAEVDAALSPGVLARIAFDDELDWVSADATDESRGVLLFSAKESVYKAWYPRTRRWLGFADVRVTFDVVRHTFEARINASTGIGTEPFSGRYVRQGGLVVTAVFDRQDLG